MATGSLVMTGARCVLDVGSVSRRAALAAAGLTVGGAVALGVFFAVGEPWGTINDASSILLSWATLPIAFELARRSGRSLPLAAGAACDVVGVAVVTAFTSALIARRMTFEESLLPILTGHALIGCWLILVGLAAWSDAESRRPAAFALAGGAGLVATAASIATGGMGSPRGRRRVHRRASSARPASSPAGSSAGRWRLAQGGRECPVSWHRWLLGDLALRRQAVADGAGCIRR